MSSSTYIFIEPPDIYHRLGLSGIALANSAQEIREKLVMSGDWASITKYEQDYLRALQEGFDQLQRIKQNILNNIISDNASQIGSTDVVVDSGLGESSIGGKQISASDVARKRRGQHVQDGDLIESTIDFSNLFAAPQPAEASPKDPSSSALITRLMSLICINSNETSKRQSLVTRLGQLSPNEKIPENLLQEFTSLEMLLLVGGESRSEIQAEYIALCDVLGYAPENLDFPSMMGSVDSMRSEMISKSVESCLLSNIEDSLKDVGLSCAGSVVLENTNGLLLTDDSEAECGLFLSREADGSFLFTTVSSTPVASLSQEHKARISESAQRLCQKKQALVAEALTKRGLSSRLIEDHPVNLEEIKSSSEVSSLLGARHSATNKERRATSSRIQGRMNEYE